MSKRYRERAEVEFSQLLNPDNLEELTDSLIEELAAEGDWSVAELLDLRAQGFHYNRVRGSFVEFGWHGFGEDA